MNNHALQNLLGRNVIELEFVRRHKKLGWSDVRGLLGTTNYQLLNGEFGKSVLHFIPPKGIGMGYDYKSFNLCVVWDIFRQEYRVFGAEQVTIHRSWPLETEEDIEEFMDYFHNYIINMSNEDKLTFMGYTGEYNIIHAPAPQPTQQGSVNSREIQKQNIWRRIHNVFSPLYDRIKNYFSRKKKK